MKATRREWIGLGVLALPCFLYSMDLTVLNLAVPTLARELKPSASQLLWVIDIYGFMVAGFLMTMGTLGDRIGRRKLLMIGAAAFGAASVVAAFSSSIEMLILMRALLGVAGATLAPSTLSLIAVMFPDERERTVAIATWIASFSAGGVVGPVIGGVMIEYFWWGSVFLVAIPPMILLLAVGPFLLPEYKNPNAGRLDLTSALLSLAAVLSVIYGVKQAAEQGLSLINGATLALGVVLALLFLRRQRRLTDPMVDLALFRNPAFSASLVINLVGVMFMYGTHIFLAQYLQLVVGLSPLEAGLWSLPSAIVFTFASFLTPPLAARIRPSRLIAGGMILAGLGFAWTAAASGLLAIVAASVIFSVGFTPVFALTTGLIVGAAPPERAGAASAISETSIELGGALGIALLGSIGAALYRAHMAGVSFADLVGEKAVLARATLGGAVAVAAELPTAASEALLSAAREGFMTGFHAVAGIALAAMLVCAILSLVQLRDLRPAGH